MPFLRSRCAHVPARVLPPAWDREDLVSASLVWVLVQARRYRPDRDTKLSTWVRQCMKWAPNTVSQRAQDVPGGAIGKARLIRKLRKEMQDAGAEGSHEQLAEALGISVWQVKRALYLGTIPIHESLDSPVGDDDESTALGDMIADPDWETGFDRADAAADYGLVSERLADMSERERFILERCYGLDGEEPEAMVVIGKSIGLSRERIRQIREKALKTLLKDMETDMEKSKRCWVPRCRVAATADAEHMCAGHLAGFRIARRVARGALPKRVPECMLPGCMKPPTIRGFCKSHGETARRHYVMGVCGLPAVPGGRKRVTPEQPPKTTEPLVVTPINCAHPGLAFDTILGGDEPMTVCTICGSDVTALVASMQKAGKVLERILDPDDSILDVMPMFVPPSAPAPEPDPAPELDSLLQLREHQALACDIVREIDKMDDATLEFLDVSTLPSWVGDRLTEHVAAAVWALRQDLVRFIRDGEQPGTEPKAPPS